MEPIVKNSIKETIAESGQPDVLGEMLIQYFKFDSEGQLSENEKKRFLERFVNEINFNKNP